MTTGASDEPQSSACPHQREQMPMPYVPPEHCLGNMEHARGARALRESAGLEPPDAHVAAVAVHLGLSSDAARLYAGCGRWDQLCELHMAAGEWSRALEVAGAHDR